MIALDDQDLIGQGTLRACFRHPNHENLVIKVPLPGAPGGDDANRKELKSYGLLKQAHRELRHISRCHGLVETDKGCGLICDCIRDFNGEISRTIWDIVVHRDHCDLAAVGGSAGQFCSYLLENDIFLFDINLKNIVLQVQEDSGWLAWAIDLKGPCDNKEFLQLSSRIKWLGRRKLKRRTEELLERIVLFREQRESLRDLD